MFTLEKNVQRESSTAGGGSNFFQLILLVYFIMVFYFDTIKWGKELGRGAMKLQK